MTAHVADVGNFHCQFVRQLLLYAEAVGVGGRDLAIRVHGVDGRREPYAAIHESRRDDVNLSSVKAGSVEQGRVAESVEAVRILADALVENSGATANGGFAIPEKIIRKAEPRTEIVPAVVHAAGRQTVAALLDHAVG
jgi:hypothetical protein